MRLLLLGISALVACPARAGEDDDVDPVETQVKANSLDDTFRARLTVEGLRHLPLRRSVPALVELVPGVNARIDTSRGSPLGRDPAARGEGQYGTGWLVDGVGTRDPVSKTRLWGVPVDAIETIDVWTAVAPPSLGRFTGMAVDLRTRSGGNAHHGSAGVWLTTPASGRELDVLRLGPRDPQTNTYDHGVAASPGARRARQEVSLTAGGPLLRDTVHYFAAAQLASDRSWLAAGPVGADPDRTLGGQGFGKLGWTVTDDLELQWQTGVEVGALREPMERYPDVAEAIALPEHLSRGVSHRFSARWAASERIAIGVTVAQLGHRAVEQPVNDDPLAPAVESFTESHTWSRSGSWGSRTEERRSRLGGSASLTLDLPDALGEHRIQLGAEAWRLGDRRSISFTGAPPDAPAFDEEGVPYEWSGDGYSYVRNESAGFPCTAASGYADCREVAEHPAWGPFGNRSNLLGVFVRDVWRPHPALTIDVGARVDREALWDNAVEAGQVYAAVVASPRLGIGWDPTGDGRTRVFAAAGRSADVHGHSLARWANPVRGPEPARYANDGTGYSRLWISDPQSSPLILCTDQSLARVSEGARPDLGPAVNEACERGSLRPYHRDELTLAVGRELVPGLWLEARGIASRTRHLADDLDWDLDAWVVTSMPDKRRDYRALELVARRDFDGTFQLLATYTLSASRGHAPGQFETPSGSASGGNGNGVSTYLDDVYDPEQRTAFLDTGYGWLVDGLNGLGRVGSSAGHYGYLPDHRFHVVELAGSYHLPWGTSVGAVYAFDSGRAWQKRGFVDLYGQFYAFPEGRGTRFLPANHTLDVRVAQRIELGRGTGVELSVDAFNLLDLGAPVAVYENDDAWLGTPMARQAPRALRLGARFDY